ncbi:MAG TPA: hypothetical protein VMG98_02545, partial [Verrucomicrobiae bacterium]|nr:hypothetical protein [Verrucomicrobiae bacterium]
MRSLTFGFFALTAAVLAACSGTTTVYTLIPGPTPTGQPSAATVSFNVLVPNAGGSTRGRPNVVVPSASLSIAIQLDSVSGTTSSVPATVANLSATATGCEAASSQLSCVINVSAPVGSLIYTLTVYNAAGGTGAVLGAGNLALTTTAGATVVAPATLTGTVAKIALSVGPAPFGASATVPVTVQAEDASNYTILGTYTNPITVTDTDPSGQTSLSSSAVDVNSSETNVTLTYAGGTMNAPATVGASSSGVSPSNVVPATFSPDQSYPTVNGAVTSFAYTQSLLFGVNGPPSILNTSSGSYTVTIATGQSFAGLDNLVQMSGLLTASAGLPSSFTTAINYQDLVAYYAWTSQANSSSLGLVGMSSTTDFTLNCLAPYTKQIVVPLTSDWDARSGSAPCTSTYNDFSGDTDVTVLNADGSYTDNGNVYACCGYGLSVVVNSDGSTVQNDNETCGCGASSIITIPAPSPNAPLAAVELQTFPGTIPSPGSTTTPAPIATSVPNPWIVYGIPNGTIPNPLESDAFVVDQGTISLPAECAIPAGLLGTNPTLREADETVILADPGQDWNLDYYTKQIIKHYYLDGVGEICNENVMTAATYDAGFTNYYLNLASNPNYNTQYETSLQTTWTYLTATTLTATSA